MNMADTLCEVILKWVYASFLCAGLIHLTLRALRRRQRQKVERLADQRRVLLSGTLEDA